MNPRQQSLANRRLVSKKERSNDRSIHIRVFFRILLHRVKQRPNESRDSQAENRQTLNRRHESSNRSNFFVKRQERDSWNEDKQRTNVESRSGSPVRSVAAATASEEDLSLLVESTRHPRNPTHDFILTGVQPFSKRKTYKPISFNPRPPPPIPS